MIVDTRTMANQSIRVVKYIYLCLLAHLLFSGLSSSVIHRSQLTVSSVSWPVTTGQFGLVSVIPQLYYRFDPQVSSNFSLAFLCFSRIN